MSHILAITKRELKSYFGTPVAYVFLVVFLVLCGVFTFYLGGLYERGQADLRPFFNALPWLFLFLIPALAMRLWSEERKSGTIELLMTLPISVTAAVIGKFTAALLFTATALALTFPLWITVNYLGEPDNAVIFGSYLGSLLMAGAYLAIGSCLSAITKNQVIAFIVAVVVCFLFIFSGFPMVLDLFQSWAPQLIVNVIASLSFLTHFQNIIKGVLDLRDIIFFISITTFWLYLNVVIVELKKAD
ncbi:MAG: ABC transporter permease [Mariprofundaceae bacterium]